MIDIVRIFCPIEKEIMGAGTQLLTFITDIRRLFEKSAYFGRKAFAEESTAANVKHFFTLLGKMFFTSYGKEFFTYLGKQIFTS